MEKLIPTGVLAKMRLLVVDDSLMMRVMLKKLAAVCGLEPHQIQEASNGLDALEFVQRWDPNVIISDVIMPRFSGVGLMQTLRDVCPERLPYVVFLTGMETPEVREQLLGLHAQRVLAKPLRLDQMRLILEDALAYFGVPGYVDEAAVL